MWLFDRKSKRPTDETESVPAAGEPEAAKPVGAIAARIQGYQEEASLRDIVITLLRGWWIVAIVAVLVVALAAYWLKRQPVLYAAEMVIGPPPTQDANRLNEGGGGLSALTQTLGITQDSGGSQMQQLVETLTTVRLAKRLQERHGMLQEIYKSRWDPETKTWVPPPRRWSFGLAIREFYGLPTWSPPSPATLAGRISGSLKVDDIPRTPFKRVQYLSNDPEFAVNFLDLLFREADQFMRENARARNQSLAETVNQRLQAAMIDEQRRLLIALLSKQVIDSVMIDIGESYAAEVIEPARAQPNPVSPQPMLVLTFATMAGIILGIIMVFFVDLMRGPKGRVR